MVEVMPRNKNEIKSVQITITTTPHVESYLKELIKVGVYGKNVAEAAERLLTEKLRELIAERKLKPKNSLRGV